jgi:hypothetical protein
MGTPLANVAAVPAYGRSIYHVRGDPTIFVIDAQGIIRNKNAREDALDRTVETLTKELEATAPARSKSEAGVATAVSPTPAGEINFSPSSEQNMIIVINLAYCFGSLVLDLLVQAVSDLSFAYCLPLLYQFDFASSKTNMCLSVFLPLLHDSLLLFLLSPPVLLFQVFLCLLPSLIPQKLFPSDLAE